MTRTNTERLRAAAALAAALLASLLAAVVPGMGDPAGASTDRWSVGAYRGSLHPEYVTMHEEWLGAPIETVMEMIPYDGWSRVTSPGTILSTWAGKPWDMVFTTPMIPKDGSTLAAGASGAYDDKWRSFAQAFIAAGRGNARIRLGHEFNHTYYPWTAAYGREADYAAYYRRIVSVTRAAGADFRFTWNVLSNAISADVEKAYPGDAYVDVIGLDIYDSSRGIEAFTTRWQKTLTQRYGLEWLRTFAAAHGKPMSFDEWGLRKSTNHDVVDPSTDSGDDTVFIGNMIDWFGAENVAYACYFDWNTSAGWSDSRIIQPQGPYPMASATYKAKVEPLLDGAPLSTTSTTSTSTTTTTSTTSTTSTTVADTTTTSTTSSTTSTTAPSRPGNGSRKPTGRGK